MHLPQLLLHLLVPLTHLLLHLLVLLNQRMR
jgi:hypothetical protein